MSRLLILLLILFVMIPVSTAAEITFTAGQKDYYVLTGEEAGITLGVGNGYGRDIPGTLAEYQITETTAINKRSAEKRYTSSKAMTIFQDTKQITLSRLKSAEPAVVSLRVVFSYHDDGPRAVTLEGIRVHFVNSPTEKQEQPLMQSSVDTPDPIAGAGKPAPTGASPAGAGAGESGNGQGLTRTLAIGQTGQDTAALKDAIIRESQESASQREALMNRVEGDPLFRQVQQTLQKQGYVAGTRDVLPINATSGNYTVQFQSSSSTSANLSATITEGSVKRMELSSGDKNLLPEVLANNETFQRYRASIEASGGQFSRILQTITPAGTDVDVMFQHHEGGTSYIRAVIADGQVRSVTLEEPFDMMAWIVPIITGILIIAIAVAGAILMKKRQGREDPPDSSPPVQVLRHHRTVAEEVLEDAVNRSRRGDYPGAYAEASRALRIFIAGEFSRGEELTGAEALDLIPSDRSKAILRQIFERCSLVTFGGRPPDVREIDAIIASIRDLIGSGGSGEGKIG